MTNADMFKLVCNELDTMVDNKEINTTTYSKIYTEAKNIYLNESRRLTGHINDKGNTISDQYISIRNKDVSKEEKNKLRKNIEKKDMIDGTHEGGYYTNISSTMGLASLPKSNETKDNYSDIISDEDIETMRNKVRSYKKNFKGKNLEANKANKTEKSNKYLNLYNMKKQKMTI